MPEDKVNTRGKLYICPTPIGNLKDLTLRVIETLKVVDIIACEDTRRTRKLMNHLDIEQELISYHKFNQEGKGKKLIDMMLAGKDIALVSDAGTPAISDPGEYLVKDAVREGIEVISLPGPSAFVAALSASGLDTKKFLFYGFLPVKGSERKEALKEIVTSSHTVVIYESPHHINKTLKDLNNLIQNRKVVIAREVSKLHEEYLRGTVRQLYHQVKDKQVKGELTLVINGANKEEEAPWNDLSIEEHLEDLISQGISKKDAIKIVSELRNVSKKQVYSKAIEIFKK